MLSITPRSRAGPNPQSTVARKADMETRNGGEWTFTAEPGRCMVPAIDAVLLVLEVFATKTFAQERVLGVWAINSVRFSNTSSHDEKLSSNLRQAENRSPGYVASAEAGSVNGRLAEGSASARCALVSRADRISGKCGMSAGLPDLITDSTSADRQPYANATGRSRPSVSRCTFSV